MKANLKRTGNILFALLLGALPLGNALADDIEIYVGAESDISGVRPNILFILDTSGSMDTNVVTQIPYDPATIYAGDCDSDSYYVRDSWWDNECDEMQRIPKTMWACKSAIDALDTIGYYQDRLAQYRDHNKKNNRYWDDDVDETDRVTECEDDAGVHGADDSSTLLYPADGGDGPYTNDTSDDIRWNDYDVFTIYSANYVNWMENSSTIVQSRIEIMQEVFKNTLDSINNVNVGLMRFDRNANGGMVVHEVANLSTAREALKAQIDDMSASGNTPLAETLYEAGLYMMGSAVDYGLNSYDAFGWRPSVDGSRSGNTYVSPMNSQCQKNFIVYLTDGEPTSDTGADYKIRNLPGNGKYCSGNCLDEMAEYLYEKDLNTSLAGTQNAITYTIGFATDQQLLSDAAQKGGGKYYTADDTAELTDALTNIVAEVLAVNTTFTAPAVSVNAFNRTVHLDQLFFTIFKPSERPHWDGNLKRFDLAPTTGGGVEIQDKNGNSAVDPNTGFFKDSAVSFWTESDQSPDGGEAAKGGAAGALDLPRAVLTRTTGSQLVGVAGNQLHEDNALITKELLNIPAASDAYRTELLQWARGIDVNDDDDDGSTSDARRRMGDPLHSKPVVVTYGGDESNPDFTVFMSTNDGYLHAVDGNTGNEYFSFVPQELWGNLDKLYQNAAGTDSKIYGIDSPITAWVNDIDLDGTIAGSDKVYIFFGQRRGGNNYYALDVTNRNDPKFMWSINKGTSGFGELAQTWSPPRVSTVNIDGATKAVLIFGGGYDDDQDIADNYVEDDSGRAVYMVDALTGDLLWWAGPEGSGADLELKELRSSIPSEVRVIDMDGNGLHDRMYVGDMGGRVFRFDIINGKAAADLVVGGMIAAVGAGELASPTMEENRKFFYAPDAALIVDGPLRFINLALGSGNQDHPLGKVTQDRLYSIRDWDVYNIPASYTQDDGTVVTVEDLFDATDNKAGEGTDTEIVMAEMDKMDGWYIDLVGSGGSLVGEKSLAEAGTLQGSIFYTTFTPVATSSTGCAPSQGLARLYMVNARFATPVRNFDGLGSDEELTASDRAKDLVRGGIPPEVTVLFPQSADGEPTALVGPEQIELDLTNPPVRTYWYENGTQ